MSVRETERKRARWQTKPRESSKDGGATSKLEQRAVRQDGGCAHPFLATRWRGAELSYATTPSVHLCVWVTKEKENESKRAQGS